MKKVLVFITLAIILHTGLHSQTYVPFPTANASWNVFSVSWCDDQSKQDTSILRYKLHGDTIINTLQYHKLYLETGDTLNPQVQFEGGLRELDKKIYFVQSSSLSGSNYEWLLYDFTKQVGDTIRHDASSEDYPYTVILGIDSVLIDGTYRKRYQVSHASTGYIIEGIGSVTKGLFEHIIPIPTGICGSYSEHICFKENGKLIYLNPAFNDCFSTQRIAGLKETYSDAEIKIYPNPAQHTVYIKSNKAQAISIFNSSGQLMEKATLPAQSEYVLNIGNYSKGTYFISVTGGTKGAVQFIKE